jgi:SAM-dependent methyltransferase
MAGAERGLDALNRRVQIAEPSRAVAALTPQRPVIEDWRPLGDSLEWALGHRYWDRRGLAAFLEDGVPFIINADGVAAGAWAELLIDHLERAGRTPAGGASVLEIGVGSGLFARHLLRAVARISPAWSANLTFIAADASPRMLEDIARHDVLEPFEAR